MAKSKRLRDALLSSSVDAMQAGRGAVSGVALQAGVAWLPVREIAPDPDQPRTHYDDERMRHLVESIRAIGQVEPVLVQTLKPEEQRPGEPFRYRCLSGHRRVRAHQELGLTEIKAVILRDHFSANERLVREIAANEVREDLTDFDRARFMAILFADRIAELRPPDHPDDRADHPSLEAVKQLVNRAFNELDRTGTFTPGSRAIIEACEESLKAIGERRNVRWFHRWGAPLLALEGAALKAAVSGLDARRALAIAQLAPRGATLTPDDRREREALVQRLAEAAHRANIPHRELGVLVKELAVNASTFGAASPQVASILAGIGVAEKYLSSQADGSEATVRTPARDVKAVPSARLDRSDAKTLRQRGRILAARWSYRPGPAAQTKSGERSSPAVDLLAVVEHLIAVAPKRADRLLRALERADREVVASLPASPKSAKRREPRNRSA